MTQGAELGAAERPRGGHAMSFSVDGWDPSYGASLELEGQLEESTARIDADVELPADRWRPIDPDAAGPLPEALLFVDGVRRVEAQVWIDGRVRRPPASRCLHRRGQPAAAQAATRRARRRRRCARPTRPAWCAAARGRAPGVAKLRRGLFSVAPHASDILTRAGGYKAHHVTGQAGRRAAHGARSPSRCSAGSPRSR